MTTARRVSHFLGGFVVAYALRAQPTITPYTFSYTGSVVVSITAGPDGNLWFTDSGTSKIGNITPAGVYQEFAGTATFPLKSPTSIVTGPDGNLWFVDPGMNTVGVADATGTILAEYNIPTVGATPGQITAGRDGNLWFTEYNGNKIARITPFGAIAEFPIPTANSNPLGIAAGPDGNIWFVEYTGNKIGKVSSTGVFAEYPIPTATSDSFRITAGPDGNLWFTEAGAPAPRANIISKIGKITTSGTITEYQVPTNGSAPDRICTGPDGNLWFTEGEANNIGRITPGGTITEYPAPTPPPPGNIGTINSIAAGPDGNIWYTNAVFGGVGKVAMATVPGSLSVSQSSISLNTKLGGASQTATLNVNSATALSFSVSGSGFDRVFGSWLRISPSGSLSTNQSITVTADPTRLTAPGTYIGNIQLTSAGSVAIAIPVSFTVLPAGDTYCVPGPAAPGGAYDSLKSTCVQTPLNQQGIVLPNGDSICAPGAKGAGGVYRPSLVTCTAGVLLPSGDSTCDFGPNGSGGPYDPAAASCNQGAILPTGKAYCAYGSNGIGGIYDLASASCAQGAIVPIGDSFCPAGSRGSGGVYVPSGESCNQGGLSLAHPLPEVTSQFSVVSSGLAYSRAAGIFAGTLTLTNIGSSDVSGPFLVVLRTTPTVTAANPSPVLSNSPVIAIQVLSVAPGQTVTANLQLLDPFNINFNINPEIFSGSLN